MAMVLLAAVDTVEVAAEGVATAVVAVAVVLDANLNIARIHLGFYKKKMLENQN